MLSKEEYLAALKERAKDSRIYREYQATGLEIAELLSDPKHKALYIKLAKEFSSEPLIRLAKDIAQRSGVKNRGAYFMKIITSALPPGSRRLAAPPEKKSGPPLPKKKSIKKFEKQSQK